MNRFKTTIATAVTTGMIFMTFVLTAATEVVAKGKAPYDHSYLPPGNAAKARRFSRGFAPRNGVRKSAKVIMRDGAFLGVRASRRAYILPYLEQDNLYK